MLIEQIIEKLYLMKLNGMAEALKERLLQPDLAAPFFKERFTPDQGGDLPLNHMAVSPE